MSHVDLEKGTIGFECRICKLEVGPNGQSLIELGCSCKKDLAFAHRQCAETWFNLKGNKVCEICQSMARNMAGETELRREEEVVEEGRQRYAVVWEDRDISRRALNFVGLFIIIVLLVLSMYLNIFAFREMMER